MITGGKHARIHDEYLLNYITSEEKRVFGKRRELPAKRRNGSEFPIELGISEITFQGERIFCGVVKDLTAQMQFSRELKRKQGVTSGIIEASFDPMFAINERGTIQMVNKAAVTQFGWSKGEFIGQNIKMIAGGNHAEKHDDYLKSFIKTGEKRVMGKKRELPARRKDGTEFPIELGLTEVKMPEEITDERLFCGFIKDLSSQKQYEMVLKRKQSVTMGIIEAALDAIVVVDERGIIQIVNQATVKQFGWSKDELVGEDVSILITGIDMNRTFMGKKRELDAKRKDGTAFKVEIALNEIDMDSESGDGQFFCGFIEDLSAQKNHR